jgi:RNA polymerase sigma-70 factor (ECF subfamily)
MILTKEDKAEDQLLLWQIKNDSSEAFDRLYDKYWEEVYSAAFKRLKDADYAKDITQDIFLQIWHKRKNLNIDYLAPYLFTSVRNNVFKWMEKEQKFTPIPDLLASLLKTREEADAELLRKEFKQKYEALINTLTPAQQEIFRLRFHDDLSTKEISEKLQISRKTVQNQLGKSVNQLRESLDLLYFVVLLHLYN